MFIICYIVYYFSCYNLTIYFSVMKVDHSTCFSHGPFKTSSASISSVSIEQSECGTAATPLILQASPGQSINISLTDFNWGDSSHSLNPKCDRLYGHIISYDSNDIIDICGGGGMREKFVHMSSYHQVQIALDESALQQAHFMINYKGMNVLCLTSYII